MWASCGRERENELVKEIGSVRERKCVREGESVFVCVRERMRKSIYERDRL